MIRCSARALAVVSALLVNLNVTASVRVSWESISRFHQQVFSMHGTSHDFGGDPWDMGRFFGTRLLYDWCEQPACD
jgi:hypothetical protein